MNYNYTFPIDLTSNGIPLGAKSIGKCNYNPNLVGTSKIPKRSSCPIQHTFRKVLLGSGLGTRKEPVRVRITLA